MSKTNWFGGSANFQAGVCDVEVKKVSDGSWKDESGWTSLGRSDHATFTTSTDYLDLVSMQSGTKPANAQITGKEAMVEVGLAEMVVEAFEASFPGASIQRTGDVIDGIAVVQDMGERLTDNLYWLRLTKYVKGQPSTEAKDRVFMLVAPRVESGEWAHDNTQQFITVMYKGFPASEDYVDALDVVLRKNRDNVDTPAHWWTMLPSEAV